MRYQKIDCEAHRICRLILNEFTSIFDVDRRAVSCLFPSHNIFRRKDEVSEKSKAITHVIDTHEL